VGPAAIDELQRRTSRANNASLVHIGYGSPEIHGFIALGYKTTDDRTQLRRVTNGAHDFAQVRFSPPGSSNLSKRDFSFDQFVAGLKFSYQNTCRLQNDLNPLSLDAMQGMRVALYNFAYWTVYTQPGDSYAMQFYGAGVSGTLSATGAIIAEQSSFGDDYEPFPYDVHRACSRNSEGV
jgi:hypothetical protein